MGEVMTKPPKKAAKKPASKRPKKPPQKTGKKAWTFMVYMAGDNNLDPEGVVDLKEMKKVGSTDRVNIIAQLDRAEGHQAKRYYIRKGGKVDADAVQSLGRTNMGDPKRLMDFIRWVVKAYPAERYALVLWNHGRGWDDTDMFADERHRALRRRASGPIRHALFHTPVRRMMAEARRDPRARAILIDDDAKDFLDNIEMKKLLADTRKLLKRKLDILGMDACLMSMAEVGYQVCESVDYTVGSQETEPGNGWPYTEILRDLTRDPGMTPRDLSCRIVERYLESYKGSGESVTQAACDLAKTPGLAQAMAGFVGALKTGLNDPATQARILAARMKTQSYTIKHNIDLIDFCALLAKAAPGTPVAQRCQDVIEAVRPHYVIAQGFDGPNVDNSNGAAIYFPTDMVSPLYAGLDFCKKTGWDGFLEAYLTAVRAR